MKTFKQFFEKTVIGLIERINLHGIGPVDAKIDSGNGAYNVLHGEDIVRQGNKVMFKTVDGKKIVKDVKEINQLELVKQAGIRQHYVDQSVSLNLAFPTQATPKWINQVHMEAWKSGIKTLYYMRTESVLRGDIATKATDPDCLSCDG